jgi:DNA-binding Lrp family transcriptional regulator
MRQQITKISAQNTQLVEGLLNHFQKGFPLVSKPYAYMAECLDASEAEVLAALNELSQRNMLTRVGPVFDHRRAGASLLAAVSVPERDVAVAAAKINAYAEVNHNYARDHYYNLWFVVTAADKTHLSRTLDNMEHDLGYPILRLPMVKSYHIDLGFQLQQPHAEIRFQYPAQAKYHEQTKQFEQAVNPKRLLAAFDQHHLRVLIQEGIALCEQPFALLAEKLGEKSGKTIAEDAVLNTLRYWQQTGLIKRFGLISNHYQMGYQSSAMVVWDIPDEKIDEVGAQFKASGLVSLCYQRTRCLPEWPYNLFCMIHSRDRASVIGCVEQLVTSCGLVSIQKELLFTTQQYKQKGGVYTHHKQPDAELNTSGSDTACLNGALGIFSASPVVSLGGIAHG